MKILEIKDLVKEYDDIVAVDGISLSVEKGQIYGMLGPNGAGKSTTIGMICGLIKRTSGDITYEGKEKKIAKWKSNIGIVPQDFAIYPDLTGEENIRFFCSLYGYRGSELKERTDRTLEFIGLTDVRKKKASEYSGGMKRRLNIGCAITHSPKLIIMDEPTVGIDPQSRNHILNSVLKLRDEGSTIIYTSHYMQEVDDISDRIAIIDKGHLIAEGTSSELKELVGDKKVVSLVVDREIENLCEKLMDITGITNASLINDDNTSKFEYRLETLKDSNIIVPIIQAVHRENGQVENISSEEPSLENVFLALTGKKLRD